MFHVKTRDGRTLATTDTWRSAAATQTALQDYWGVQLFIVQQTICPVHGTRTFTVDHSGDSCA